MVYRCLSRFGLNTGMWNIDLDLNKSSKKVSPVCVQKNKFSLFKPRKICSSLDPILLVLTDEEFSVNQSTSNSFAIDDPALMAHADSLVVIEIIVLVLNPIAILSSLLVILTIITRLYIFIISNIYYYRLCHIIIFQYNTPFSIQICLCGRFDNKDHFCPTCYSAS